MSASSKKKLRKELAAEMLTEKQRDMVDQQKIAKLFASPVGQKMRSCGNVLREFKFSILDDGRNYDPALAGEQILLQGVVDCALIEEDGITVLDFKTDFVTEDTLSERVSLYRPQVSAYADALSRIYGLPVKKAMLYFFCLDRFVDV